MELTKVKNLVFDLGGVVIDLHLSKTIRAFAEISGVDPETISSDYVAIEFFKSYEKGLISDNEFRQSLSSYLNMDIDDKELDRIWNLMLGQLPARRINKIKELGKKYNVYLLSNTNAIHIRKFNHILLESSGDPSLTSVFDKVFLSYEMNMRKPDQEIFVHLLEDRQIKASETLFLDDTLENLEGAKKLGINVFHVTHPDLWIDLLDE